MKITVDKNWWKTLFDHVYLQTDARSVCDEQLTLREVDLIEKSLNLKKSARILDLCGGQGRHALELARRGYANIVVFDYSFCLLSLGRKNACKKEYATTFIKGDARSIGLRGERFDTILILGNSFGYFVQEDENMKCLMEAYRLLKTGGTLVLDLPNREYLLKQFKPFAHHKVDNDIEVTRNRELGSDVIFSREKIISRTKGCIRDQTYCIKLYTKESISMLLGVSGFSNISVQKEFVSRKPDADYGGMANRVLVKAHKPQK